MQQESSAAAEPAIHESIRHHEEEIKVDTMKAVIYKENGDFDFQASGIPVPKPKYGEVLIRIECAIINPYDIQFLEGKYKGDYTYPLVAGSEGSGTVIGNGGGLYGWSLLGKRVAFTKNFDLDGKQTQHGSFAEYICTSAWNCIPIGNDVFFE